MSSTTTTIPPGRVTALPGRPASDDHATARARLTRAEERYGAVMKKSAADLRQLEEGPGDPRPDCPAVPPFKTRLITIVALIGVATSVGNDLASPFIIKHLIDDTAIPDQDVPLLLALCAAQWWASRSSLRCSA